MTDRPIGAILCPDCGRLIDARENKCPYCGAWRPGLFGLGPTLQRILGDRLDLVTVIPVACVILYVLGIALNPREAVSGGRGIFGLFSPGSEVLYVMGATGAFPAVSQGRWWTILTAMYLHGGFLHILFNILWIRSLGPHVAEAFGPARFFVIFTLSGAGGFVASNALGVAFTIGASGAVFGLLGALIAYGRSAGGSLGRYMSQQLWTWAIALFAFGFFMRGVNNYAHLGGFVVGWISARLMLARGTAGESRGVVLLALGLLALTVLSFVIAFVGVVSFIFPGA
jgi:rhomboid protease GluP